MPKLISSVITLFMLSFSTHLLAHPHHDAIDAIVQHGIWQSIIDKGLYLLPAVIIAYIACRWFASIKQNGSIDQ